MTTGKTVTKYTQVFIEGYDFSGVTNAIGELQSSSQVVDYTAYSDGWNNNLLNQFQCAMTGYKGWFNVTSAGVINYAQNSSGPKIVTVGLGILGTLAVGDPAFMARLVQRSFTATPEIAGAISVSAEYESGGGDGNLAGVKAWGNILKTNALISSTTTGTTFDSLAATTAGGMGFLHVTAAGGVWSIEIRQSTDNFGANDTNLLTFSSDGSAITAEQSAVTGSVARYLRYKATRTSGNLTALIGFVRY
jgi:hypothetical protein